MEFGEHTKSKKAEEFYNELWSLESEKEELLGRLRDINFRLNKLNKNE